MGLPIMRRGILEANRYYISRGRSGDDRPMRNTVLIEFEMPVKSEFTFVKQLTLLPNIAKVAL